LPDLDFEYAALLITRVVSVIDERHLCLDLGHKAVASENPLPQRIHFLNAPDFVPIQHSEEHLVVETSDSSRYQVGSLLYAVPEHICPTVALYDRAYVVRNKRIYTYWEVTARNRTTINEQQDEEAKPFDH
jgi:D-serine deaminase-like pyridoxal phosphate-dependent protein